MQRSEIPQASPPVYDWYPIPERWLLEADEVPVDIISSEWLDEFTLLLTSDEVLVEPTGVTLEYAGPDEKLCYIWGKQIEPFGARESFAGYPTTPAPHNSTHENGGSDEININGLSGFAGIICLWHGAVVDIPSGWHLCDGTAGTPDLQDRFIVGAGSTYAPDQTGGTTFHVHSVTINPHTHDIPEGDEITMGTGWSTTTSEESPGGNTDGKFHLPPYYALCYIMKL